MKIGVVTLEIACANAIQAAVDRPQLTRHEPRPAGARPQAPSDPSSGRRGTAARGCREHQKRRADGQAELPALGRGQSSWNSFCQSPLSFHSGCAALSRRNGPSTR